MAILTSNISQKLRMGTKWMRGVRSYDSHSHQIRLQGPISIQVQTIDRCNASCVMCPYSAIAKTGPANVMDDGLYRQIIEELRQIGTLGTLLLMLQNEPLLDRKFPDRVRLARETLDPGVHIATVTNGAPLTMAMIRALAASGIDRVDVSIDAVSEDTYGRIRRGLNFRRVVENTLSLIEHLGSNRVRVRFLRQRENEGEEDAFATYWRRHGVTVGFTEPTNRAGWLESYDSIRKQKPDSWKKLVYPILNRLVPACPLPFASMCILWDGRAITCCHDWGPRDTVGNLSENTLEQIWRGEKINHCRHLLWNHRAEESLVCAGCTLSDRFWRT